MMFKCGSCNNDVRDGAQCSACMRCYDFSCAGVTEAGYRKLGDRKSKWKCLSCKGGASPLATSTAAVPSPLDVDRVMNELKNLSQQMSTIKTLVEEMKSIKSELKDLKTSVEFAHDSVKSCVEKISSLEDRMKLLDDNRHDIESLQKKMELLESSMKDYEQRSRLNNVEIKGIPMTKSENLYEIISKVSVVIGCEISKNQINYIARVPMRNDNKNKTIIATFNNRYVKEDFVASARAHKMLVVSDLGFQGGTRIYINDHLTVENKMLLNKTKQAARDMGFMYVWVRNCKIFVRKNSESPIIVVKSEIDLKRMSLRK